MGGGEGWGTYEGSCVGDFALPFPLEEISRALVGGVEGFEVVEVMDDGTAMIIGISIISQNQT